MSNEKEENLFQTAKDVYAMMRNNTVYHPAYVARLDIKCDLKAYVIKSPDGVRKSVLWFNEETFDEALKSANDAPGRGVRLEKDTLVVKKGTTLWEVMVWSEKIGAYHKSLVVGVYAKKEDALDAVFHSYDTHKRYLQEIARMAGAGIENVGLPEKEFVDFESPNEYKEFL